MKKSQKFYYEIIPALPAKVILIGPLKNIRNTKSLKKGTKNKYPFAQVIDGKVVSVFTKDEILITDKKL